MANHNADRIRAKLILRVVRACVAADVADLLGYTHWDTFIHDINTQPALRKLIMDHPAVQAVLEPVDDYVPSR